MNPNKARLVAAKEYIDKIMKSMEGACLDAYVFGSVSKNQAKESSDVDIILVIKKPTREERYAWNTEEEIQKRECLDLIFAKNSHMIFKIQEEMEKKYGFPLAIYTHYKENGGNWKVPINAAFFPKFGDLISDAIPFSKLEALIQ